MCLVKALGKLRRCQDELLHRRWLAVVLADPPAGCCRTKDVGIPLICVVTFERQELMNMIRQFPMLIHQRGDGDVRR